MAQESELLERYRARAVVWREMLLFPMDAALDLVNDCEREKIRVLGYEAFDRPQGETIRCRLEDCLDLSIADYWDYSIEELSDVVRDHIRARRHLLFEFVLP